MQFTVCNSVFIVSLSNFHFDFNLLFDVVANAIMFFFNFSKFTFVLVKITSFSALKRNKMNENRNKPQLFRIMLIFN
jgi:hypothetical protein